MDGVVASRMTVGETVRNYYGLTKPGIIRGNAVAAAAGFLLAARGDFALGLFALTILGLSLVIASGCIVNNYIDREIDARMVRTKQRAMVNQLVNNQAALSLAGFLGVGGALLLLFGANALSAGLAVFGWIAYVYIYGAAKRRNVHGTLIGSISGAIPPVVGYTAVSGRLDLAAALLFILLVTWQMPHFYAIAMYRMADYKAAGIPVLPVVRGLQITKIHSVAYIVMFGLAAAALTVFGYTSYLYLVISLLVAAIWLIAGVRGLGPQDELQDNRWARRMFGISLLTLTILCLAIGVDSFLPFK